MRKIVHLRILGFRDSVPFSDAFRDAFFADAFLRCVSAMPFSMSIGNGGFQRCLLAMRSTVANRHRRDAYLATVGFSDAF